MLRVCYVCHQNKHANEKLRVQQCYARVKLRTYGATKEQQIRAENFYRTHPEYRNVFHYNERCPYGLPCSKISVDVSAINRTGINLVKEFILLYYVDKTAFESELNFFRGEYPQTYSYLKRELK